MVITTNQSGQPPQAPSIPVVAQQWLSELVNYYRELAHFHRSSVDAHRQLLEQHAQDAEVAEKQLASLEAMVPPLTREALNQDAKGQQMKKTEVKAKNRVSEASSDTLAVPQVTTTEVKKSGPEASQPVPPSLSQKHTQAKSSSSQVTKTQKKTKQKSPRPRKKSTPAHSSRLPYSDKLAARESLVDAVAVCLQAYYPQVISTEEVVKYYYPEELEGEARKKAYSAFRDCLSRGVGKQGWLRVSIGKYQWKDEA